MQQWLQDYAYRIAVTAEHFLVPGAAAVIIALITIGWQAYRSAVKNPADSLRYE